MRLIVSYISMNIIFFISYVNNSSYFLTRLNQDKRVLIQGYGQQKYSGFSVRNGNYQQLACQLQRSINLQSYLLASRPTATSLTHHQSTQRVKRVPPAQTRIASTNLRFLTLGQPGQGERLHPHPPGRLTQLSHFRYILKSELIYSLAS